MLKKEANFIGLAMQSRIFYSFTLVLVIIYMGRVNIIGGVGLNKTLKRSL